MKKKFYIYRYFNDMGVLLYIGQSTHVLERLRSHRSSSEWFDESVMMTIERCKSKIEMDKKEIAAIANEFPIYNKEHNSSFELKPKRAAAKKKKLARLLCDKCSTEINHASDSGWTPEDNSWRDKIRDEIAEDLKSKELTGNFTYTIGREYKLRSDKHIQVVQKELRDQGHLIKQGRLFKSAYAIQEQAA